MLLLDLAKSQKVDLEKISITQLADQFIDFINSKEKINLDLASEYLLMATWLAYLKSKLLLPQDDDDDFKAIEVAEKLKLQLKKLELIRLLSDQLLKKDRLGSEIRMRGMLGELELNQNQNIQLTLYELLKSYSNHVMRKNFLTINIPKLPVCTPDQAIDIIKKNIKNLNDWKDISELIPKNFKKTEKLKKIWFSWIFCWIIRISKGRNLFKHNIKKKIFTGLLIKEKNEK